MDKFRKFDQRFNGSRSLLRTRLTNRSDQLNHYVNIEFSDIGQQQSMIFPIHNITYRVSN
jgi:hypothetical protein